MTSRRPTALMNNSGKVVNLMPLTELTSLEWLVLKGIPATDLPPLKRLENLSQLVLPDGRELGGFDFLGDNSKYHHEVQEFLATL